MKEARPTYRGYLLAVLLVILMFNTADRIALGLVLQNVKMDLSLSDTQLGFLSGIAFALFYAIMGIPIARWADRGNRVTIISLTIALWSVTVALCGITKTFIQLVLVRIAAGIGEAGCIPPAHSLIADYFSRADRPRAVAIYLQGWNLSVVIGYFLAGWANQVYGWRVMFFLLSLPGAFLAALVWFTIKEPRSGSPAWSSSFLARSMGKAPAKRADQGGSVQPAIKEVLVTLWGNHSFRQILIGYSLFSFFSYGLLNWQAAFFERSFALKSGVIGTWFAVVYGLFGVAGTYLGGEWASRRAANNERLQLKGIAILNSAFNGVVCALVYFSNNYHTALAWMALSSIGGATITGPLFATIQTLVSARMRAMSIAITFLFVNLIGMGLGPLVVGVLSDALRPLFGDESLRYSLLAMCPGYFWVSWHLWRASKTVCSDVAAVQGLDGAVLATSPNATIGASL
jgi:MFS family permease